MVLTDKEKRELALEVLRILREQSVGVNELPRVETMDGVCALPAYQTKDGVETAVVVPINLLGKPAIDAAAEAQEVITLAQDAINDANKATDSINASLEEVSQAADEALEAANSVNEAKTAATTAAEQAQKAADSAFRAADDADTVSSAVSEEWSGLKDEIIQATNAAGTGAGLAEEAVQKVNDFITEFEGKLMTDEEREKLLNTYTKSDTYNRQEVDEKNQDILDELNGKSDTGHSHSKSEITDFPASMPASDVPAWAKAASKPGYTASEVGAAPANHSHSADQISDTETKVMMTKAERSKLASIEKGKSLKIITHLKIRLDNYTENGVQILDEGNNIIGLIWPDSHRNYIFSPYYPCAGIEIYSEYINQTDFSVILVDDRISNDTILGELLIYTLV